MKKTALLLILLLTATSINAQYSRINAILDILEARRGVNENLKDVSIANTKFVLVKDAEDHTERDFVIINDKNLTYVEVFDDKASGQTTSNVFSGDVVHTKHNIVSIRADKLEGEKIIIPITKTFLVTMQKKILYLIDVNTKERWVEEKALAKK